MKIEEILAELFYDNLIPLQLLRKYNLDGILNKIVSEVEAELEKKQLNFAKFNGMASTMLVSVNSILKGIHDPLEKRYLESILKDVSDHLMKNISKRSADPDKLKAEIRSSLETTSSIQGYNFQALTTLLRLPNEGSFSSNLTVEARTFHYFDWRCTDNDLWQLLGNMHSEAWIQSKKDFEKLFTNHGSEKLRIKFCQEKTIDLLALFDQMKKKAMIKPRGSRGHFNPLRVHLVNFQEKPLFQQEPKIIKTIAKRNREKWTVMTENAQRWISGFKVKLP